MCGIDTDSDPRETWLARVKARLLEDLRPFREDVEGPHDQIEEWSFRDGRIFASVGNEDDESDPDSGHGWMCRLLDSEALGAAGFRARPQSRDRARVAGTEADDGVLRLHLEGVSKLERPIGATAVVDVVHRGVDV
jgi:hypothetical protein